jgi:apolipoprotein N-acyltransferase
MVWTTLYENGGFYNVFEFYTRGAPAVEYQKRAIFPFIDYTPQWAQRLGFYTTPYDARVGPEVQPLAVHGIRAGALLCSEIHRQDLVRSEAVLSPLIISAGSEAIFLDDVASHFSLEAAQYRAVENNIPVIRANLLGPSGIITPNGALQASLPRGKNAIMSATIALRAPHPTLYTKLGNSVMVALLMFIFFIAAVLRVRKANGYLKEV